MTQNQVLASALDLYMKSRTKYSYNVLAGLISQSLADKSKTEEIMHEVQTLVYHSKFLPVITPISIYKTFTNRITEENQKAV